MRTIVFSFSIIIKGTMVDLLLWADLSLVTQHMYLYKRNHLKYFITRLKYISRHAVFSDILQCKNNDMNSYLSMEIANCHALCQLQLIQWQGLFQRSREACTRSHTGQVKLDLTSIWLYKLLLLSQPSVGFSWRKWAISVLGHSHQQRHCFLLLRAKCIDPIYLELRDKSNPPLYRG